MWLPHLHAVVSLLPGEEWTNEDAIKAEWTGSADKKHKPPSSARFFDASLFYYLFVLVIAVYAQVTIAD